MNEHQRYEHGFGPVYSVPLIDKLPLNRENPGGMLQQMPSAADLEGIRTYRQGARVCAGYEVLLNHWRLQQAEIERLKKACELYRQASIQSHNGHWDPTGKWGAGCPECNRAAQLRSEAETFLKEEDTHEMA